MKYNANTTYRKGTEMANDFYVYLHKKKTNGEVFYVGKGCGKRKDSLTGRSNLWGRIAKKHGHYVELAKDNISEDDAFKLEVELIFKYGRIDMKTGTLANHTDGGEGSTGVLGNYDSTVYTFAHDDGRIIKSTPLGMIKEHGCNPSAVSGVVGGSKKSICGWWLNHVGTRKTPKLGAESPHADQTKYLFVTADGKEEYCTRIDLCEKYNIRQTGVSKLINGANKSACGWYLDHVKFKKETIRDLPTGEKHHGYCSEIYMWIHDNGTIFESTKLVFREKYGLTSTRVSALVSGKRKMCHGWRCSGLA